LEIQMNPLFTPLEIGRNTLSHRIVMPPLTRMRARTPGHEPGRLAALHYAQRATAGGLIIAEGSQVSLQGKGYPATPGIHTPEQVAVWREVVDGVHEKGGTIFLQLWHVGRISHPSHQPGGTDPVAPSAIAPRGKALTADWKPQPFATPRALALDEIRRIVSEFAHAAANAELAGFDGVEIHAANGYLIDQFLEDRANQRHDAYGGTIENRSRFLREIVEATTAVLGRDRVGVRLSPFGSVNDIGDSDPQALFDYVIRLLSDSGIAYLHLIEPRAGAGSKEINDPDAPSVSKTFRNVFAGPLIASGGYDLAAASKAVSSGDVDAVAFGRAFIANPDLVDRLRRGLPLNRYDRPSFYGGDAKGYTDYPEFEDVAAPELAV